eukprot:TRINITY_DN12316_c0_g1_i4.p2 TRINITY_DN12316_c0_g1~~TRINITY_DN12316_c0_g1_i4.p2  ORF type:complete len:113 (+),score=8.06 TRINITY_DN12316_c0_g1_i4:1990-2328(+)
MLLELVPSCTALPLCELTPYGITLNPTHESCAQTGFYARCMGLPIDKLVVATNRNDILSRFFQHGDYSARPVQPSLGANAYMHVHACMFCHLSVLHMYFLARDRVDVSINPC